MAWIAGGTFLMGSDRHYPEERPSHSVVVEGFWMDQTAVTNQDFDRFVAVTGHKTIAERPLDPALYPAQNAPEQIRALLPHLALCVMGRDEAEAIMPTPLAQGQPTVPELLASFFDTGVCMVALKLGANGCVIATRDQAHSLPAVPAKVIDTTGAGDSFLAGLITGILRGMPLREAGLLGAATAACCVTGLGATAGLRSFDDTLRLAEAQPR